MSDPAAETATAQEIRRLHLSGVLLVIAATILLSAKAIFVKLIYVYDLTPAELMVLRQGASVPLYLMLFLWYLARRQHRLPDIRSCLVISLTGIIGYYAATLLDLIALQTVPANLQRLIIYLFPTLVVLFSWRRPGNRIGRREVVTMVICYCGLLLYFTGAGGFGDAVLTRGALIGFGSTLCYAVYLVLADPLIRREGAFVFTSLSMLAAFAPTLLHHYLAGGTNPLDFHPRAIGLGVALGLFSTVLPSYLLSMGIQRMGSARAGIIAMFGPVATAVMAFFIIGETLSPVQGTGMLVVIGGVYYLSRK